MKNERQAIKRVLSLLLVFVLVVGAFPGVIRTVRAEEAGGSAGPGDLTETIPGSQLLTLDGTDPEGFDPNDDTNPYGSTKDAGGTLAIPWDELVVLTENYEVNTHRQNWYKGYKRNEDKQALEEFQSTSSTKVGYKNLVYVQSASFDKSGTGRRDVVAYVGFDPDDNKYHLWMVDTADGNKTYDAVVDHWEWDDDEKDYKEHKPIFTRNNTWQCDHYAANSLLSITAGDFGRGYETVVVSASFRTRDDSGGSLTFSFEYAIVDGELTRIGSNKLEWLDSKTYINTVSTAAGDLNGDGYDEFVAVLARTNGAPEGDGETRMLVYPGGKGKTGCIVNRKAVTASLYKDFKPKGEDPYRLSFAAPGTAIGDVDGDGKNEIVVGGYRFLSDDGGDYKAKNAQVLGVYELSNNIISEVMFAEPDINLFIKGGFWEKDQIHPRAAVATVAFNGHNGQDLIFFNGEIWTYNNSSNLSKTYTPSYFEEKDDYMGSDRISNAWVSCVAVGNFDHNDIGRQQVYFVVALKNELSEAYGFKVGMIGATYKDTEDMLGTITGGSFYSSDIDGDDYQIEDGDAFMYDQQEWTANHTVITACDMDFDGVRLRYAGKNYIYTDPKIEAVLQAAPYFSGVQEAGSTVYAITTSYGESTETTVSLDWSVGLSQELQVEAGPAFKVALDTGAAFNYTWEWEDGWTVSYKSSFETTNQNTVLLQRTPIILYDYDMYNAKTKKWMEKAVQVPMPLGPVWSQLSIEDYNAFVDSYDAMVATIKKQADTNNYKYDPPVLYKIIDTAESNKDTGEFLIGNEGKPENYLHDWNNGDLTDAGVLSQGQDMQLTYSGSSKTMEYEHSASHTEGEGFSGGFSINFTCQVGAGALGNSAMAGIYVSADFLKGTCEYKTTTKGNTVSGTVKDLNGTALKEQGIPEDVIRAYQFFWSFGRWYVKLGTGHSVPEAEEGTAEALTEPVWDNSHVPVYGYKVSNISMPPQPPELSVSYADGTFTLIWEDEHADAVDGYYVYQVVNGDHVRLNPVRLAAHSNSFTVSKADLSDAHGNLYLFAATSAIDLTGGGEMESVWSNQVFYVPPTGGPAGPEGPQGKDGRSAYELAVLHGFKGTVAEWIASLVGNGIGIERIEKTGTSEDGLIDTYTIYYTDGNTMTFTVGNGKNGTDGADGRGIVSFEKTATDGNVDTYTVTYTDGTTSSFTVTNGTNGLSAYEIAVLNGFKGTAAEWIASLHGNGIGVDHIEKTGTSEDSRIDTYTIYYTDGSFYTFTVTNGAKGEQGEQGEQGETGVGIASIEKTGTSEDGLIDTYTITYTDGTTDNFTLTNGADGREGLSAYEIAVLNGFKGTMAEWIASLTGNGIGVDRIEKTGTSEDGIVDTYTIYYTDGSSYGFTVTNGVDGTGIASIAKTSGEGNTDTYTVTLTDNSTYSFTVTNGTDGVGVAKIEKTGSSEDGLVDTYTITLTNGETFSYTLTNGQDGKDGNGVASIEKTEPQEGADPNLDVYLIKMTNGDMYTFSVRNGIDGVNGKSAYELAVENGYKGTLLEWLASLRGSGISLLGIESDIVDELTTAYTFLYSDGTTFTFSVRNGKDGEKGEKGEDGVGIASIEKTRTDGSSDVYTITYTDGRTFSFTIYNGKDGADGKDGKDGKNGTDGTNGKNGSDGTDGRNGTDGKNTSRTVLTDGRKGADGADGKDGLDGKDGKDGIDGVDGKDGLDGKDGKDGVGVAEVKIKEGDLVLTMSDGTVINAGSIVTENRVSPETQKSVPWWIIFVLIGWNTLLTAGFIALAVTKKGGSAKAGSAKKAGE